MHIHIVYDMITLCSVLIDETRTPVSLYFFVIETDRAVFTMKAPSRDDKEATRDNKEEEKISHHSHKFTPGEVWSI